MARKILMKAVLVWVSVVLSLQAQFPGPPPVPPAPPVPAVPPVPGAVPAAPAAAPRNLWSFLCLTPEQKENCKKCFCNSIFGKLANSLLGPVNMFAGGLINPPCPTPDQPRPEDLAKRADSADGAAARVKQDEMEAKARRANVRYLGTVDCSRYPEVEKALINALRADKNECVRLEAAIVLGTGCCCTKKTVEALALTATGSDKDGNPVERSHRVREAARISLEICNPLVPPSIILPPENPVPLPDLKPISANIFPGWTNPDPLGGAVVRNADLLRPPSVHPASFVDSTPEPPLLEPPPAIQPLPQRPVPQAVPQETRRVPHGQQGLFQILMRPRQPGK